MTEAANLIRRTEPLRRDYSPRVVQHQASSLCRMMTELPFESVSSAATPI